MPATTCIELGKPKPNHSTDGCATNAQRALVRQPGAQAVMNAWFHEIWRGTTEERSAGASDAGAGFDGAITRPECLSLPGKRSEERRVGEGCVRTGSFGRWANTQ